MALLEIDHLSCRVPERPLLDGLELTVAAGEILALVGTNGTGQARRGWLAAADVPNTRPLPELRRLLAQVRR